MKTGRLTAIAYGALDASFPALLHTPATSRGTGYSRIIVQNVEHARDRTGDHRFKTMQIVYKGYNLRPEIVEATYYLHHFTHDPQQPEMGENLRRLCEISGSDAGYAANQDVVTKKAR